ATDNRYQLVSSSFLLPGAYRCVWQFFRTWPRKEGTQVMATIRLSTCEFCGQEAPTADSCKVGSVVLGARSSYYFRIRFGQEQPLRLRAESCPRCGTPWGGFHHGGCEVEMCPLCSGSLVSCYCDGLADDE